MVHSAPRFVVLTATVAKMHAAEDRRQGDFTAVCLSRREPARASR